MDVWIVMAISHSSLEEVADEDEPPSSSSLLDEDTARQLMRMT